MMVSVDMTVDRIKEMQDNLDRITLELTAYRLIEVIHGYTLDKSLYQLTAMRECYIKFITHCSKLIGKDINNEYTQVPVSLISVSLTTQWIVGLVKAIKNNNREQISSCAKNIVLTMKGNLYV